MNAGCTVGVFFIFAALHKKLRVKKRVDGRRKVAVFYWWRFHVSTKRHTTLLKTDKVLCRKPAKYYVGNQQSTLLKTDKVDVENRQSTLLKTDKLYNVKENNVKDK